MPQKRFWIQYLGIVNPGFKSGHEIGQFCMNYSGSGFGSISAGSSTGKSIEVIGQYVIRIQLTTEYYRKSADFQSTKEY